MSITKDKAFDYRASMKETSPEPGEIKRGLKARRKRREISKARITIRIDEDVINEFKQLVPEGKGYQSLINQALREWIEAQGVKALISKDLSEMIGKAVSSVYAGKNT